MVLALYLFLSIVLITHHEPWRDEGQGWLDARDSPTIITLFQHASEEKTPVLWHLLIYPLAKLGLPFYSMAILHHFLALISVFLFIQYSPFTKPIKVLFTFSYYMLYEYNVVARNYTISILLLLLLATFYPRRFTHPFRYLACLFLLPNTNTFSIILTGVFLFFYMYELVKNQHITSFSTPRKALFILLPILVFLLPFLQLAPSIPSHQSIDLTLSPQHLYDFFNPIASTYIPISIIRPTFWDRFGERFIYNLALYFSPTPISPYTPPIFFGSLLYLLSLSSLLFEKRIDGFFIYLTSSLSLLLFFFFFFREESGFRQYGLIFVLFFISLWINRMKTTSLFSNFKQPNAFKKPIYKKITLGFIYFILICALIQSVIAGYFDFKYTFSNGKKVHEFIQQKNLDNDFIMIYPSGHAAAILPYSNYSFYCFQSKSYCDHHSMSILYLDYIKTAKEFIRAHRSKDILLILAKPDDVRYDLPDVDITADFLTSFRDAITDDNYALYVINKTI